MMSDRPARITSQSKRGLFAAGLLILLLAGCGQEQAPEEIAAVRPVKTLILAGADSGAKLQYPGTVRAAQRADLSFEVPGQLKELPVKEGQVVKRGDLIAKLDDRDFMSSLQSAQAEYDNAMANFERASKLVKDGNISRTDYDRLKAQKDVKAAHLAKASKALEDTKIHAPFGGRVARRLVENFQDIQAKQPIIKLQDIDQLEIVIDVPENRAIRANVDGAPLPKLQAAFEASPGRDFELQVKEFSTEADPDTQTFKAVLMMPQPEGLLILPGMTAMVSVDDQRVGTSLEGGFTIPAAALFADEAGVPQVWVVDTEANTVHRRTVETAELTGSANIRVVTGLKAGEMLAVSGVTRLREGMEIRPIDKVEF